MPLYQRLLFALCPGTLVLVHYLVLKSLSLSAFGWLGSNYYIFVAFLYYGMFVLLVIYPSVPTHVNSKIRIAMLIAAAVLAPIASTTIFTMVANAFDAYDYFDAFVYFISVPAMVTTFLLIATALRFIGRLQVATRYWAYIVLAGIIAGVSYGAAINALAGWFCYGPYCFSTPGLAPIFIFLLIWPALFCLAVFFGRSGSTASH